MTTAVIPAGKRRSGAVDRASRIGYRARLLTVGDGISLGVQVLEFPSGCGPLGRRDIAANKPNLLYGAVRQTWRNPRLRSAVVHVTFIVRERLTKLQERWRIAGI